ncbi:type IV pilin N-terminal domain-containing protein [Methanoculleus sp. 7T]|uniref:type IV pilin N-terminal domain-containing protein n=1 Tax=Methanoculleus sp. 7T TaxID=2937282 RepID=UPI0020BE8F56|nr:type IV pilin N-terminal domain-containing protein [Methanoculleus sp. 7T]
MLVVTIIIAAVVSGFAGGLIGEGSQKAPSLTMDVAIANSGSYRGSEFSATVLGVSEPIPTKDLKILTSWETTVKTNTFIKKAEVSGRPETEEPGCGCILNPDDHPIGTVYRGGTEILPGITNSYTRKTAQSVAPYGLGPGVGNLTESDMVGYFGTEGPMVPVNNWHFYTVTHFGNYSLEQGTVMVAEAAGRCPHYPRVGGMPSTYSEGGYGPLTRERIAGKWQYTPNQYHYKSDTMVYTVYTGDKTTPAEIVKEYDPTLPLWEQNRPNVDGMQAVLGCGWENLRGGTL